MKKLKLTKKAKGGILGIIAGILLIALIVVLLNVEQPHTINLENLQTRLINEYVELNLEEMDIIDVQSEFGFEKTEVKEAVFLKSLVMDNEGKDITPSKNMIVIMNTENYDNYYGIFESHIDSYLNYSEDDEITKLYSKAILKKKANYVYLIISLESKDIEQSILELER